jgi:hypothetical protein
MIVCIDADATIKVFLYRSILDEWVAGKVSRRPVVKEMRNRAINGFPQDCKEPDRLVEHCCDIHGDMFIHKAPYRSLLLWRQPTEFLGDLAGWTHEQR